jgi:WD40 repeat protein
VAAGRVAWHAGGRLHLLAADTLRPLRDPLPLPGGGPVAVDRTGDVLAADGDGTVALVDLRAGAVVRRLRRPGRETAHDGRLDGLALSPDGTLAATAETVSDTTQVRLWDAAGGRLVAAWAVPGGTGRLAFRRTAAGWPSSATSAPGCTRSAAATCWKRRPRTRRPSEPWP